MPRPWAALPLMLLAVAVGTGLAGGTAAGRGKGPADNSPKPTAEQPASTNEPGAKPAATPAGKLASAAELKHEADTRLEGEKRFHNNCGRCHLAPQKFPPRVMAMVVRHMRVRANITDEDMRLILNYMTQ
jgi:hypothetical protein